MKTIGQFPVARAVHAALIGLLAACGQKGDLYLPDESDNHVMELAVAAGGATILTFNRKDFLRGELRFPDVAILSPGSWLKEI